MKNKIVLIVSICISITLALLFFSLAISAAIHIDQPTLPTPKIPTTDEHFAQALSNLPLQFIANHGQSHPASPYAVVGTDYTIYFTKDEVIFHTTKGNGENPLPSTASITFPGSNPNPTIQGLAPMKGVVNFFLGDDPSEWQTNVPTFGSIIYRDLYPGVDLVFRGAAGRVESEFLLSQGADPNVIQMDFQGADDFFKVVNASQSETLANGPALAFATYLGGSGRDDGYDLEVGPAGEIYVTGLTQSAADFPTLNPYQDTYNGGSFDAFVTKYILANGVYTYAYSTYLGGSGDEFGNGIGIDGEGNAYVVGYTYSDNFPTHNAIQPAYGGNADAFVTKIISDSGVYTLGYSTYLGGSALDYGRGIDVDADGAAYVTGQANSTLFPTYKPIQPTKSALNDAFVAKIINAGGVYTFAYSTFLGGNHYDEGLDIAADGEGNAYVTGYTWASNFPTHKAIQPSFGGGESDAFVTKIITASGVYTYGFSTYLGGGTGGGTDAWEQGKDITVDDNGQVYVTGYTRASDFPTHNPIQANHRGGPPANYDDAFVTKIISSTGGYTYSFSTYLGGSEQDIGSAIRVNQAGIIHVVGRTSSSNFPIWDEIQTDQVGWDAFVTQLITASGVYTYGFSTYLGGDGVDECYGISLDTQGNLFLIGRTTSGNFPTSHATQTDFGGNIDAFVAKIDTSTPTIAATRPALGGTYVSLTAPVVFTFSEAISTSTFSYTVTPETSEWGLMWDESLSVVTMDHTPFAYWTTYTITVDTEDWAGLPLADGPYVLSFTTAPYMLNLPLILRPVP